MDVVLRTDNGLPTSQSEVPGCYNLPSLALQDVCLGLTVYLRDLIHHGDSQADEDLRLRSNATS